MTSEVTQELRPSYQGRRYFIRGEPKSPGQDPDDFAVMIYYKDASTEEEVQIARVDTAHGYTHFDKLYRRDQPKEAVDWGYWEAISELMENWRVYAESYENAHG